MLQAGFALILWSGMEQHEHTNSKKQVSRVLSIGNVQLQLQALQQGPCLHLCADLWHRP